MKKLLFFGVLIWMAACSSPKRSSDKCHKDTDCKGARICENGKCITPEDMRVKSQNSQFQTVKKQRRQNKQQVLPKPSFPKPQLPNIKLPGFSNKNFSFNTNFGKGFGLNLNFKLKVGKDMYSFRMKGLKKGRPVVEVCVKNKCENLDLADPSASAKLLKLLGSSLGGGKNDPMAQLLMKMLQGVHTGGGTGGNIKLNPFGGGGGGITIAPPKPPIKKVYRSWDEIVKDGTRALGNEAVLEGSPVQVSDDVLTLKTKTGRIIQAVVSGDLARKLPSVAKISGPVVVRIDLLIVSKKKIKGRLKEFSAK